MNATPISAVELCHAMRHSLPFDPAHLSRILGLDERRGLLEVQGSTPWAAIAAELRPGDAPAAAVHAGMPTVGESVAGNAAGPDGHPAVAHVEALTLVTPEGELRRLSRTADRELFSLAVGGHGVFGPFYSVTLRIDSLIRALERSAQPERIELRPGGHTSRPLELLLPPERLEGFIADADARCNDWRFPLRSVELRQTAAESDSFLRWACREFVELKLNFSVCEALGERVRATQLRRELIDAAIAAGGRFPIASTREATREQTQVCYPQLRAFLAHKRRFDPNERLTNEWYHHQRRLVAGECCEVRWSH
jgi:FAD/FMN-containing dehydrogenase